MSGLGVESRHEPGVHDPGTHRGRRALAALLGPREGSVVQLEGGITNRNFRVNFGGTDYVVRLPGKRTELLGHQPRGGVHRQQGGGRLGIAPRVAALLERAVRRW